MGKYTSRVKKPSMPKRNIVNPYMRGIGCLFMLIVPVFSYLAGFELAERGFGYPVIPREWYGSMRFPPFVSAFKGLDWVADQLSSIPHLPATLAITVVVLIVVGGLISVIFGWMHSIFAPTDLGPLDVPAPRVKTRKYKR